MIFICMKKCYTCQQEKETVEFNKSKCRKDGLNSICKECSKKRSKQYYKENTEYHRKAVYRNKQQYGEQLRGWISDLKSGGCCICGEKEICCLDFHHIDSKTKDFAISSLVYNLSRKKLGNELTKCAIVCSNCHRKIHIGVLKNPIDKKLENISIPNLTVN